MYGTTRKKRPVASMVFSVLSADSEFSPAVADVPRTPKTVARAVNSKMRMNKPSTAVAARVGLPFTRARQELVV